MKQDLPQNSFLDFCKLITSFNNKNDITDTI